MGMDSSYQIIFKPKPIYLKIIYQVKTHSLLYDITFYLRIENTQTKAYIANLRIIVIFLTGKFSAEFFTPG